MLPPCLHHHKRSGWERLKKPTIISGFLNHFQMWRECITEKSGWQWVGMTKVEDDNGQNGQNGKLWTGLSD
jgi:hypothetical protein